MERGRGPTANVAFAGLTAAGKTTHARLLADELGYAYVSATELMLELLGMTSTSPDGVWFHAHEQITAARAVTDVDDVLDQHLQEMARTNTRTVFDTWTLAWVSEAPIVRVWVESDRSSRIRKAYVSQGAEPALDLAGCAALVQRKDDEARQRFILSHGYDLYNDRHRYHALLDNSHLIPNASAAAAAAGVARFSPAVTAVTRALLCAIEGHTPPASPRDLLATFPRMITRLDMPAGTVPDRP
jgi:cytidylate kinase